MRTIFFHGELCIVACEESEVSGNKLELSEDLKLADSETTGNHHMLEVGANVAVWSDESADKFFVRAESPTKIYCKLENRHTDLVLPPGTYKITPAQEWDHIAQAKRRVLD